MRSFVPEHLVYIALFIILYIALSENILIYTSHQSNMIDSHNFINCVDYCVVYVNTVLSSVENFGAEDFYIPKFIKNNVNIEARYSRVCVHREENERTIGMTGNIKDDARQ